MVEEEASWLFRINNNTKEEVDLQVTVGKYGIKL
jgi:hypothetical protein